jgi:NADPH:quinone reductase-like Zn-dependent oxidoreductase
MAVRGYGVGMKAAVIVKPDAARPTSAVQFKPDWADVRAPGAGEAVVRTLCSALNHLDLWMAKGQMGPDVTYPTISGSDACGIVESVGPGVDAGWVGQRVILNAALDLGDPQRPGDGPAVLAPNFRLIGEHFPGVHAERFVAPVANLAALPPGADAAEAAAFGLTHLTAYSMMVGKAGLRPGQWVLITGIGGGVALAALAIAKHLGCRTIVTSRQQAKLDRARSLGAEFCVLDQGQDWSRDVRGLTGKRGVDVAVDSSGKATHLWALKSLARGGAYVTCGATSGGEATTDLARIFWMQLRIIGSTMASTDEFREVAALFARGALRPVVDSVYPATKFAEALARLESAGQFGKVVIDWR